VISASGGSPGLTISDLDFDGAVALRHNMTGHSAWYASNAYHQECVSASPVPASAGYVDPFGQSAQDPTDDADVTISSSGRAYLSRANGFATPDFSSATPYAAGSRPSGLSTSSSFRGLLFTNCPRGTYRAQDPMTGDTLCIPIPSPFQWLNLPHPGFYNPPGRGGKPPKKLPKCGTLPDFLSAEVTFGNVVVGGVTLTYNPRNGDVYEGGVGGFGLSPTPVSVTVTGQYLQGSGHSAADVSSFQSGWVFGASAGALGVGWQGMWSPNATQYPGNVSQGTGFVIPAAVSATGSYSGTVPARNIGAACQR
jgi:hypothetical protein